MSTVKIYYQPSGEIRRVALPANTTYEQLQQIVARGLPTETPTEIKYQDDEGDHVTISSNEEWNEALRVVNGGLLRLKVTVGDVPTRPHHGCGRGRGGGCPWKWRRVLNDIFGAMQPQQPAVHHNIICDGCDATPIVGNRYKSQVKADFDLCQTCFDKCDETSKGTYAIERPVRRGGCHRWAGREFSQQMQNAFPEEAIKIAREALASTLNADAANRLMEIAREPIMEVSKGLGYNLSVEELNKIFTQCTNFCCPSKQQEPAASTSAAPATEAEVPTPVSETVAAVVPIPVPAAVEVVAVEVAATPAPVEVPAPVVVATPAPVVQEAPAEKYTTEEREGIQLLADMGFTDVDVCLRAIRRYNNDLARVVQELLNL